MQGNRWDTRPRTWIHFLCTCKYRVRIRAYLKIGTRSDTQRLGTQTRRWKLFLNSLCFQNYITWTYCFTQGHRQVEFVKLMELLEQKITFVIINIFEYVRWLAIKNVKGIRSFNGAICNFPVKCKPEKEISPWPIDIYERSANHFVSMDLSIFTKKGFKCRNVLINSSKS